MNSQTDTAGEGKVNSEVMNSQTDTAREGKVNSEVMNSQTDTAREGKVNSEVIIRRQSLRVMSFLFALIIWNKLGD